jgi:hypothetical protein
MSGILENRPPKTSSEESSVGMQQQHGDDKTIKRIAVKTKVMFFWIASMQYELRKQHLLACIKIWCYPDLFFLINLLINRFGYGTVAAPKHVTQPAAIPSLHRLGTTNLKPLHRALLIGY